MEDTTRRVAAGALVAIGAACVAGAVIWDVKVRPFEPLAEHLADPGWPYAAEGLLLLVLGLAMLWRAGNEGFGWAMSALGMLWALDGLAQSYVRWGLASDQTLPAITFVTWFLMRFTGILPVAIGVLLLVFPTGRFHGGPWRSLSWTSVALMLAGVVGMLITPLTDRAVLDNLPPGADPDPTSIPAIAPLADVLEPIGRAAVVGGVLLAMLTVVARYRDSRGEDRDRMRWLLWAVIVMAILVAIGAVFQTESPSWIVVILGFSLAPVAMTIAILDPRLVSIEHLLIRTIVHGAIAAVIVAIDLVVLAAITAWLGDALDQTQVVVLVLGLAIVLYAPLRRRVEGVVRRLVLGERGDPYAVVSGLASQLEQTDESEAQLAAVATAVADAFGLSWVEVEVEREDGQRLVAAKGSRPSRVTSRPVRYRGRTVGRVTVPTLGPRHALSARDEALLGDVVRQAAIAVRANELAGELRDSRHRLVLAREEERRRMRRDLHDGLGPALSGVVFRIDAARLAVESDPVGASEQLVQTRDLVKDVVADVRRLVHDLRPPALDDLGLVGALSQLIEATPGLAARVEADLPEDLGAAVEVATYRIAAEAFTNVTRHADARTCLIRLTCDDAHLVLEVIDDGVGIAPDVESGVGLVSMRERAAELGGTIDVECPPRGGTLVHARLPLHHEGISHA